MHSTSLFCQSLEATSIPDNKQKYQTTDRAITLQSQKFGYFLKSQRYINKSLRDKIHSCVTLRNFRTLLHQTHLIPCTKPLFSPTNISKLTTFIIKNGLYFSHVSHVPTQTNIFET